MTQYNYISMTIIDATVWLAAALFIRYYETMLFSAPDQNLAILYAVTVPVSYVSVLIAQKLMKFYLARRIGENHIFEPVYVRRTIKRAPLDTNYV